MPETPGVYVYVKLTDMDDVGFMYDLFLNEICPSQIRSNALPFNDEDSGFFTGLVTKFDADRLKDISPQYEELDPNTGRRNRRRGRFHDELVGKLNQLARSTNSNIILWVSENTYCWERTDYFIGEIRKILAGTVTQRPLLAPNNLKTIVIMSACRSDKWAHTLNRYNGEPNRNPEGGIISINRVIPEPEYESQKPIFLGFEGMVHPYKSDFFVCENLLRTYPSIVCPPDGDRLECCKAHVKAFEKHFVEEFKGERDCTKISWDGIASRINNIVRKIGDGSEANRATLVLKDSTIRHFNSTDPASIGDGTFCRTNDCEIINNIINNEDEQRSIRYASHMGRSRYIWGQLMRDLNAAAQRSDNSNTGTYGTKFNRLFDSIPPAERRDVVNLTNKKGETALFKLLLHRRIQDKGNKVAKVLQAGGRVNIDKPPGSEESIASLVLNEYNTDDNIRVGDSFSLVEYILLYSDIDILTDTILAEKRAEAAGGDRRISIEDERFKKAIEGIVNKLRTGLDGNKKKKMNGFLAQVATHFNIPLNKVILGPEPPYVKYTKKSGRPISGDVDILNVLRRPITFGGRNMIFYEYLMEKKTVISTLAGNNLQRLSFSIETNTGIPVVAAAVGGRITRTKKNRRSKRRQTRRR